ncbi:right-handed parallel beta-helix repeat-containing protein [Herbiconiux liukaitaii]|uniref:right-handed parallel beta-helix repeat-containing protein n=1 Tax=Herbiconiux liukaitaii TaxID=3342799 RepID=UPI0035BA9395
MSDETQLTGSTGRSRPPRIQMSRRQAMIALGLGLIGGGAAAAIVLSDGLKPARMVGAVTPQDYGAIADGTSDCTDAINQAFKSGRPVHFPSAQASTYVISGTLFIESTNRITFDRSVRIVATTDDPMLVGIDPAGDLTITGHGAILDLNAQSTAGLILKSSGTPDSNSSMRRVNSLAIANNRDVRTAAAAVEIRGLQNVTLEDVEVADYRTDAPKGDDLQVYGIGFFYCTNVAAVGCSIRRGCIGFEVQACSGIRLERFSAVDLDDNGIYVLSGSDGVEIFDGELIRPEEGIVVLSPAVSISNVLIEGSTNKAISLRNSDGARVVDCTFRDNAVAIGDDGSLRESRNVRISRNTFETPVHRSIYLVALADSDISANSFSGGEGITHIRLQNSKRVTVRENSFRGGPSADSTGVRIGTATSDCAVEDNKFDRLAIGIVIDDALGSREVRVDSNDFSRSVARDVVADS